MPSHYPYSKRLFSLKPVIGNERGKNVISHAANNHLTSTLPDGTLVIDIGFHIRGNSSTTLVTLGRGFDVDIYVEGSSIAKIQCSFEIDLHTGIIMFCDRSFAQSTQVSGENATLFEHGRIRRVLVQHDINTIICMGGERRNLIQFALEWHRDPTQTVIDIKNYEPKLCDRVENPRLARTVDETSMSLSSRRETRTHTPRSGKLRIRYVKLDALGAGSYGEVHKVIDVDSGRLMAVKIPWRPATSSKKDRKASEQIKREVETMSTTSHPHIVEYIASQGFGGPRVEIFMGLKEGTLYSLVESGAPGDSIAKFVLRQMLQALDHIALKGIIHRDVKPENILYISLPGGQYHFQLGDFGLCNRASNAVTEAGTSHFRAPEVLQKRYQTCKADVWSLFVTMIWTLNINGFRHRQFESLEEGKDAILFAASATNLVSPIREMAIENPEERASAAQMLVKLFNGEGLSTPQSQIQVLIPQSDTSARIAWEDMELCD